MEERGRPPNAQRVGAEPVGRQADRLGGLIPGVGHIVHMPAHIYIQVGRFRDSMECNEKASDLDRKYFKRVGPQGIYHAYHAHNNHFRVWSAMYQGRYKDALESCRRTILDLPEPMQADPSTAEWLIMETHVHIRFGEWEAALRTPRPRARCGNLPSPPSGSLARRRASRASRTGSCGSGGRIPFVYEACVPKGIFILARAKVCV